MKFLVQTTNGHIVFDFAFELLRCKEYYDWRGDELEICFADNRTYPTDLPRYEYVPVGSVEFVSNFLKREYPGAAAALMPLNVPEDLFRFAGRAIKNVTCQIDMTDLPDGQRFFRKSLSTIKHKRNGIFQADKSQLEEFAGFQVSEVIEFLSEWRVFVFQGKVQYIANYAGDPELFPHIETIHKMIEAFSSAPVAYTLDVGLKKDPNGRVPETVVVECHRFFSCGLYGFSDLAKYPAMLSQAWAEMTRINFRSR